MAIKYENKGSSLEFEPDDIPKIVEGVCNGLKCLWDFASLIDKPTVLPEANVTEGKDK